MGKLYYGDKNYGEGIDGHLKLGEGYYVELTGNDSVSELKVGVDGGEFPVTTITPTDTTTGSVYANYQRMNFTDGYGGTNEIELQPQSGYGVKLSYTYTDLEQHEHLDASSIDFGELTIAKDDDVVKLAPGVSGVEVSGYDEYDDYHSSNLTSESLSVDSITTGDVLKKNDGYWSGTQENSLDEAFDYLSDLIAGIDPHPLPPYATNTGTAQNPSYTLSDINDIVGTAYWGGLHDYSLHDCFRVLWGITSFITVDETQEEETISYHYSLDSVNDIYHDSGYWGGSTRLDNSINETLSILDERVADIEANVSYTDLNGDTAEGLNNVLAAIEADMQTLNGR